MPTRRAAEAACGVRPCHLVSLTSPPPANPEFGCPWDLMPWKLKSPAAWTPQIRRKEAALLQQLLALERAAVAKIEALLPLLES